MPVIFGAAAKVALIVKYDDLLSFFNVACYSHDYHSGVSVVVYQAVVINIVIFKLYILNEHIYYWLFKQASCNICIDYNLSILYSLTANQN
jgi:hypothetical protein